MLASIKKGITKLYNANIRGLPWASFLRVSSVNIFAKIIGMGSSVWLARCMAPSELGVISFVLACQIPIHRIISLGLGPILVTATRDSSETDSLAVFRYYSALRIKLISGFIALWLMAFSFTYFGGHHELGSVGIILLPGLIFGSLNWMAAAQRFGKINECSIVDLITTGILSVCLLVMLRPGAGVLSGSLIYSFGVSVGLIISLIWARRLMQGIFKLSDKKVFYRHIEIRQIFWPLLIAIASYGYTALEIPLVGWLYGFEIAGLYRVAVTIPGALLLLVSTFVTIMYPRYVEWSRDLDILERKLRSIGLFSALALMVGILGFWIFGEPVIRLLFGERYLPAYRFMVVLAAAKLSVLWVNVWSISLLALREEKYVGQVTLLVSVLSISSNFLFKHIFDSGLTVAYLGLISEVSVGVLCWLRIRTIFKRNRKSE